VSTDYQGGSIEPLEFADCETTADGAYSQNLHSLFLFEWQGDAYQWQWPTAKRLAEHAAGVAACRRLYYLTDHSVAGPLPRNETVSDADFITREIDHSHDDNLRYALFSLRLALQRNDTGEWLAVAFKTPCTSLGVPYESYSP
jgi:hypothetical protein